MATIEPAPAQLVERYSFGSVPELAKGAASVKIVGFCESPAAGKYFVADARAVGSSGSGSGGFGTVFSFNARRRTAKPVFHAPTNSTLLWFGAVGATASSFAAYLRQEDDSGAVLLLEPAFVPWIFTFSKNRVVRKLEPREQYGPPKEFKWTEVAAVGQRANGNVVVAPAGKKALFEISRPSALSYDVSRTPSAALAVPGAGARALVAAAFLSRFGHEFAVMALDDSTVHLLRLVDERRFLERCAEWRCGGSRDADPIAIGGLWCARDSVLCLTTRAQAAARERQQRADSSSNSAAAGPLLHVLDVEHSQPQRNPSGDQWELVPRRALTGLPAGPLLHAASVAPDSRRITIIDVFQTDISLFQF